MGEFRTFNFINSIKGGCGKTTFSVFLARYLNAVNMKAPDTCGKNLLLDMDLQGTAMQYLFEGADPDEKAKNHKYLNEAVRIGGEARDYVVRNRVTEEVVLDIVFADSKYGEKEKFRVSSKTGYSPTTQYNVFKGGLQRFLRKLKDMDYRHFIFDMPPNSDGFSGAALECVMNDAYDIRGKNDRVNLFFLTGFEQGQVNETFKEVEALLINRDNLHFNNFFIVFNDNIFRNEVIGTKDKIDMPERFRYNIAAFVQRTHVPLTEEEYEKIHFLRMDAYKAYAAYCMKGAGLQNLESKVLIPYSQALKEYIPEVPVVEYADLDNVPVLISEVEFLKNKITSDK